MAEKVAVLAAPLADDGSAAMAPRYRRASSDAGAAKA
jgi:hypothetical protein